MKFDSAVVNITSSTEFLKKMLDWLEIPEIFTYSLKNNRNYTRRVIHGIAKPAILTNNGRTVKTIDDGETFSSTSGTFSPVDQPPPAVASFVCNARRSAALVASTCAGVECSLGGCTLTPGAAAPTDEPAISLLFVLILTALSPSPLSCSACLLSLRRTLRSLRFFSFFLPSCPSSFVARSFPQSGTNWLLRDVVSSARFVFHARG